MHISRLLPAAALLLAIATALPGEAAERHLHLEKSEPSDSAVVATPPAELRLWFSEDPPLNVTRVALTRGRDTLTLGPLTRAAAKAPIVAKVTGAITPGDYVVGWRTMGRDGHVISGKFTFRFAPASTTGGRR